MNQGNGIVNNSPFIVAAIKNLELTTVKIETETGNTSGSFEKAK